MSRPFTVPVAFVVAVVAVGGTVPVGRGPVFTAVTGAVPVPEATALGGLLLGALELDALSDVRSSTELEGAALGWADG